MLVLRTKCTEAGLIFGLAIGSVFRVCPPLTITEKHVDEAVTIFEKAVTEVRARDQT